MNKPVLRLLYLILELVQENLLGKYPATIDGYYWKRLWTINIFISSRIHHTNKTTQWLKSIECSCFHSLKRLYIVLSYERKSFLLSKKWKRVQHWSRPSVFMQCATTTSEQTIPRLLFKKRRLYGARILDHIQGRKNRKKKQNKLENLTIFPAALSKRVTPVFEVKY